LAAPCQCQYLDSSGIYIAGSGIFPGETTLGGLDAFVRKYDLDGNEVWTQSDRVFALQGGERLHCMGAADGGRIRFGEAEVLDLPFLDQILDGAGHVLDGDVGIGAMLVEEIDGFDAQPLERFLGDPLDLLWTTVQARSRGRSPVAIVFEAEFGGDDDLILKRFERFADEQFVGEGTVDFRCIEEGDAPVHGGVQKLDHLLPGADGRIAEGHSHAAQAEGRNFQICTAFPLPWGRSMA
jgi:hypothetical protein